VSSRGDNILSDASMASSHASPEIERFEDVDGHFCSKRASNPDRAETASPISPFKLHASSHISAPASRIVASTPEAATPATMAAPKAKLFMVPTTVTAKSN